MLSNLSIRILHLLSSQNLNTFVLFSNSPKFEREEEVIDGRNNEKKTHGYLQTWNLSKILHRRIFRQKILHRQFHLISTILVRKTQKMSENGEVYTAGKNFTLPPALTGWTNSMSASTHAFFSHYFSHQ